MNSDNARQIALGLQELSLLAEGDNNYQTQLTYLSSEFAAKSKRLYRDENRTEMIKALKRAADGKPEGGDEVLLVALYRKLAGD